MFGFGDKRPEKVKENFMSRKYHLVLFWNTVAAGSIVLQGALNYFLKGEAVKLPLEIIIGIAGVLSGGYMGINVLEKKIIQNNPIVADIAKAIPAAAPTTPPTTEVKK